MKREVRLTDRAGEQLEAGYHWYAERSLDLAARWYNGIIDALLGLENNPERFGLAREGVELSMTCRELLYGVGKRKTHRALFAVRPDAVVVYAIRHLAQQDVTPEDL